MAEGAEEITKRLTAIDFESSFKDIGWLDLGHNERGDKVWKRKPERENTDSTTLKFESAPIKADLLTLVALIRESQLGSLAGKLLLWNPVDKSPFERQIHYCSYFPFPFQNRDFCIKEHCGGIQDSDGQVSIVLLNYDADEKSYMQRLYPSDINQELMAEFLKSNKIHGNVNYSIYFITKISDDECKLRRYFSINMHLPWSFPRFAQDKALGNVFMENIQWIRSEAGKYKTHQDLPEPYQEVIRNNALYPALSEFLRNN